MFRTVIRHRTFSKKRIWKRRRTLFQEGKWTNPVFAHGFYIFVNELDTDFISPAIAIDKIYEPKITALFERLVKKNDLVVDVGANLGWYSLLSAKMSARVSAFEPEPVANKLLRKSVSRNGFSSISVHDEAISNQEGIVSLTLAQSGNKGTNSILAGTGTERIDVKSTTLDAQFQGEKIGLLKIDVEGAEPLAIEGARDLINKKAIRKIVMEWNPASWKGKEKLLSPFAVRSISGESLDHYTNVLLTPK